MRLYTILDALAKKSKEVFPVGSVYINANGVDAAWCNENLGGRWTEIGQGRVLMGAGPNAVNDTGAPGSVNAGEVNIAVGVMGGTAKAVLPIHTHEQDPHSHDQEPHTHIQEPHKHTQAAHSHAPGQKENFSTYTGTRSTETVGAISGSGYEISQVAAKGSWGGSTATKSATPAINEYTAKNQYETATNKDKTAVNQNAGVDPVMGNLPPFLTVRMFKRVE